MMLNFLSPRRSQKKILEKKLEGTRVGFYRLHRRLKPSFNHKTLL